jgi:carboxymethylenebutenolidase
MSRLEVAIPTPDGDARAFVFTPDEGPGPWAATILFMDAPAIRPALFEMGERLAQAGYYVLLPDMFWRAGPYPPLDIAAARAGDPTQQALFAKLRASTDNDRAMRDTGAFLDWLSRQPGAKADKVGVTGYCMGGGIALRAAGTYPGRIAAAGSFHGGNLATEEANSPHLLAPRITAKVLVAGADQDASLPPEQVERLSKAFKDARVDATVSTWTGARHGWVPSDMPVHNPEAAERHWTELVALFDGVLK